MENVTIVGTEAGVLVLATESGMRYALPIDEVLRREIKRAQVHGQPSAPVNPREIQTHIRAGLSAAEVAELLGVSLDDVTRFEGPVLAEREHIIGQALAVPVLVASEVEPDAQPTFGTAIRDKLSALGAGEQRWASWKDEHGWTIKVEFTASEVAHDARWSFDPRSGTLAPLNADATQLSRHGTQPEGLIPRLRALDAERTSPYKDDTRFDEEAFEPVADSEPAVDTTPLPERANQAVQEAAMTRAPEESTTSAETADLLEALRRRRGQREPAPSVEDDDEATDPIALFDALEPEAAPAPATPLVALPDEPADNASRKKRRNAMPSWDEIVFGARTDE